MNVRSSFVLLVFAFNVSCSGDVRIIGDANSGGATTSAGARALGGSSGASNSTLGDTNAALGGASGSGGSIASPGTETTLGGTGFVAAGGAFGGSQALGSSAAVGASAALGGRTTGGGTAALGGSSALGGSTSVPICSGSIGPGVSGQSCTSEGYVCQFAGSPCGGVMRCEGGSWKQETTCPSGTGGSPSGSGGATSSSDAGTAMTGGTSATSTSTSYGGLCNSGCSLAQVTIPTICQQNQELVACTASPNPNLSTIMATNGCTDSGLDMIAFCCPTAIETQCM